MDSGPVDAIPVVVEGEPVCQRHLHRRIVPASPAGRSGTVDPMSRLGILLAIAVPLAAADLLVKARVPTDVWAYHERSYGWLLLSVVLLVSLAVATRIPSLVVASAAGVLAGGLLGNSVSAAWNEMTVPNPLVIAGDRSAIAFNLADIWALVGILLLVLTIGSWLIRNRELLPSATEVRASGGRAFGRLFD